MTLFGFPGLCKVNGCRKVIGHRGHHDTTPTEAWSFLQEKDLSKLKKAGYATPRGGDKNGYQNHVNRNNRVIIPFKRLASANLPNYEDGYIISFTPEEYFIGPKTPNPDVTTSYPDIEVGVNAFVVYRTLAQFRQYPPLDSWQPREMQIDGAIVDRRSPDVEDVGHYITRPTKNESSSMPKKGPPQGIFAPEYAPTEVNYLCQCILAWIIIRTSGSPYVDSDAQHLRQILEDANITEDQLERIGALRSNIAACPLCLRHLDYTELHEMINFDDESGNANAALQSEGATRSTIVNLFHMQPLLYSGLMHTPENMAWGHAVCNTRLGQRKCYPISVLEEDGLKIAVIDSNTVNTFGWISRDFEMIRSRQGSVWIRLNGDIDDFPIEMDSPEDEIHEASGID